MLIISSREFRDHQKNYLDKVDEGVEILIQRGKNKSYKIVAVSDDDTLMSKEAFFAKLKKAEESIQKGRYTEVKNEEELKAFLDDL